MNILKLTFATAIILASYNVNATNYKFVAADQSRETKVCVHAGNNNKDRLKATMRLSSDSNRFIANHVTCNDMVLVQFAYKYDALETANYLNRYTKVTNRIPETNITIRDIAAIGNQDKGEVKIIYIHSAPK
jgi:hypothetical protein